MNLRPLAVGIIAGVVLSILMVWFLAGLLATWLKQPRSPRLAVEAGRALKIALFPALACGGAMWAVSREEWLAQLYWPIEDSFELLISVPHSLAGSVAFIVYMAALLARLRQPLPGEEGATQDSSSEENEA